MKNSIVEITERIKEKSRPTRTAYLTRIDAMLQRQRGADRLGCANVAKRALRLLHLSDRVIAIRKRRIR